MFLSQGSVQIYVNLLGMVWFFFVFKLKSLNANASAISYLWLQFSFYCLVCCQ